jgi:outer membrane lipoprotein
MSIKSNHILSFILVIAAMLLLAGCTHVISKEVLQDVDTSVSFMQLSKDPEAYTGQTVICGGDVIETQNLSDKTLVVVLQRPLGSRGEPSAGDVSEGRFIIQTPGFLDPAIYSPGRKLTVAGTVAGKEVRPLGEIEFTYPIIEKRELYLWPEEEAVSDEPDVHFGLGIGIGF